MKKNFSDFINSHDLVGIKEDTEIRLIDLNIPENQKEIIRALAYEAALDLLLQYHEWLFSND